MRAELLSSGYVITPRDEGGIHVAYILQIDFKGTPHLHRPLDEEEEEEEEKRT